MQKIEISDERTGIRIAITIIFIILAAVFIAFAVSQLTAKHDGWVTVEPKAIAEKNCCQEFILNYELGTTDESAAKEHKKLAERYAYISAEAYRIFNSSEQFGSCKNLCYLNNHINEIISVDENLYKALLAFKEHGNESLFLEPIYSLYSALFLCTNDLDADEFDPVTNEIVKTEADKFLAMIHDRDSISLEFFGDNKVRLNVSSEYIKLAEDEELTGYVDFCWLRNAFIIDYIADGLIAEGYTHGSIASYDGFSRNLGGVGLQLSSNIFDRTSGSRNAVARLDHKKPINFVCLRDYERTTLDKYRYYQFENGETRMPYIDIRDGKGKAVLSDFVAYSDKSGCAEIALQIADIYIADEFNPSAVKPLKDSGVYVVYCIDRTLFYSDSDALLTTFDTDKTFNYKLQPLN